MPDDPFAHPDVPCPECGGRDGGHFITCSVMAEEVEERQVKRNGVCPVCWLVRPCEHG